MKWVKRGLWAAAWGAWFWLGLGLLHHLPKRPGSLVCRWDWPPDVRLLTCLNNQLEFATLVPPAQTGPSVIQIWDVATGQVTRQFPGPLTQNRLFNYVSSPSHPFLVTSCEYRPGSAADAIPNFISILDLRSGGWSDVKAPCIAAFGEFHRKRPWYLCTGTDVVSVVDLDTKRVVFKWTPIMDAFSSVTPKSPFFFGDDHVAIPVIRSQGTSDRDSKKSHAMEIWSLAEPSRQPNVVENVEAGYPARQGGSRILWTRMNGRQRLIEVFDVERQRVVYPMESDLTPANVRQSAPVLSGDGRRILDGRSDPGSARLIDIDSGRTLWTADANERTWGGDESSDTFYSTEDWSFLFLGWKKDVFTRTQRSMVDGSLILRSWESAPSLSDAKGSLFFAEDGVRLLPFVVDWPLLALCQTILALPLVLVWAVLRWRRKRLIRMRNLATS